MDTGRSHGGSDEVPLDDIERYLLGARRTLTRIEVAEKAGVPIELAEELWSQLGFPRTADDDIAFTKKDVAALEMTAELVSLGILEADSRSALVRTWGAATRGSRSGRPSCWVDWRSRTTTPSAG